MPQRNLPTAIGRYEVIDRHGSGAMGVVYRARDPRIGRQVAIKVLRVTDEGQRDRFLQEAGIAGALKHPAIVTVYDYGEHEGQPYIVMEFVDGVTLAEKIRAGTQMPVSRKLDLVLELLSGLDYAHRQGVIHRDVKPVNLMEERSGALRILDFGIARVAGSEQTLRGTVLGTPNYMSPEQVEGRSVDARSDIFAAGLVCYELLSYRQAFPGDAIGRVMTAVTREKPVPLHELCPDLDPALEVIVNEAIQKDPNRRYQSMAAMALDVRRVRRRLESGSDEQFASTVNISLGRAPAAGQTPPRTGKPDVHREQLSKRRGEVIARHLEEATQAMANKDFAAALECAEQAALLDPDDERVVAMLDKARASVDEQQIALLLAEARRHLEGHDGPQALDAVRRALEVDPSSAPALDLQAVVTEFIRQEQERQEAIASALARAREHLAKGSFESAIRAASEVLTHDPTHQEGHALTAEAVRALEERRRQEAAERAARAFVAEQRLAFAAGRWDEALAALERYTPPHELIAAALEAMRADRAEIEARRAAEARQREAETRAAAQTVAEQRAQFDAGRRRDAVEALERFRPRHDTVLAALTAMRAEMAQIEAREAEERRQREQIERAARAAVVVQRMEFAAGRRAEAMAALERHTPQHEIVQTALATMREEAAEIAAREAAERQQREAAERAARAFVASQLQEFEAGRRRESLAAMQAYAPPHEIVTTARADLLARLIVIEAREAEERRERERLADAARRAVTTERQAFAAGRRREAIAALERYSPAHEVVTSALVTMRTELASIEAREEEQRRQRRLAEQAAEQAVASAHARFSAGQRAEAIAALEKYAPSHPVVATALQTMRAEHAALERKAAQEEERRRALAEEAERARRKVLADEQARNAVSAARAQFEQGRRLDAIAALERYAPPHEVVTAALALLKTEHADITTREREAERQAREAQRQAKEAQQRKEAEARRQAEEQQRAREAEAQRQAEEQQRAREAEARRQAEEQQRAREAEAQRVAEEQQRAREAEAQRVAEEQQRAREAEAQRVAEEQQRAREAEAQRVAEEQQRAREAEAQRVAEEQQRAREAEAQRVAEEQQRAREAEAQRVAEEQQRAREAEARRVAEEQQRARRAEAQRQAEEQQRAREEESRRAEAQRRSREAAAQRQREFTQLLGDVRADLAAGRLETARLSLEAALRMDGTRPEAHALAGELNRAVEARHRQEQWDRNAAEAVEAARSQFLRGEQVEALDKLRSFTPQHPLTTAAYEELLARAPLEPRDEEVHLAHQSEEASADPEVTISTRRYLHACVIAEDALSSDDLIAAAAALDRADALVPRTPEVADLRRRVAQRGTELAKRRMSDAPTREGARRTEEQQRTAWAIGVALQRARASGAREAIEILKQLLVFDPGNTDAEALLQARVADELATAEQLMAAGEDSRALGVLEQLAKFGLAREAVAGLRAQLGNPEVPAPPPVPEPVASAAAAPVPVAPAPSLDEFAFRPVSAGYDSTEPPPVVDAPPLPVPPAPTSAAVIYAVAVAAVLLAAAAGWYFLSRPSAPPAPPKSAVPQTQVPEPTDEAASAPPAAPVAPTGTTTASRSTVELALTRARGQLDGKAYLPALATVTEALARAPGNGELTAMVPLIMNGAEREALNARREADAAGGGAKAEYTQAANRLIAAMAAKRSGVPEQVQGATAEFLAAAGLFRRAAGALAATEAPGAALPGGSGVADAATVRQVLAAFATALGGVTLADVQRVYPSMPATAKARLEQYRRDYVRCEYTYEQIELLSGTEREASVRAERVDVCTNTANQDLSARVREQILLRRNAAGTWAIADVQALQ